MADAPADEHLQRALLVASGASGSWDWDIDAGILRTDARFAELYGIDAREAAKGLPTASFFKSIHPDDRARIRIAVAGILAGAETFSKEFRVVGPDGAVLWMHARGQSHFDANDQPVRFTGLLIDVTDRKRTEEQLRIAQSAGGVGTFEYIDGFATATVSAEFCKLLGLHPARVLPTRTINGVLVPGERPIIPEAGDQLPPPTLDGEFRIRRGDAGELRWIARRGEVVRDDAGRGFRIVGVIYDVTASKLLEEQLRDLNDTLEARVEAEVTERHQAEQALRQAQKMEAVGQLTGGIAHDFNNLLTIITGNIDTVMRRVDSTGDPRILRSLENALKGAQRAASLTQRLLAFSRQQPLKPRSIDVARLLVGMSDLLTRSITETIAIRIDAGDDLKLVEVDPHQLENAILNLAVNARDAMPGGGALTIKARGTTIDAPSGPPANIPPGDYVTVAVHDTGHGMDAATLEKVFDPFFTTKEVGKGTGLGLSMVYGFVKQSGGYVTIESRPDQGSTVTLVLPTLQRANAAAPSEEKVPEPPKYAKSETVMVVEDDEDVRVYAVESLRELGYRVIEAPDGAAALALLKSEKAKVDLLLTDVVMPNMSGAELAEAALDFHKALKVLFVSGYTRDAISRDGRIEPGVDLLSKPFTFAALASRVRELLDRR